MLLQPSRNPKLVLPRVRSEASEVEDNDGLFREEVDRSNKLLTSIYSPKWGCEIVLDDGFLDGKGTCRILKEIQG